MGYSKLANYVKFSPNCTSPRNRKIDKITIHHMAGNLSVESCGAGFANSARQASSNYAIDNKLNVGCYVDENNRAWTSSSPANDHRAVTIELANDGGANTNWHVSDAVIEKCIELCVDICKRNGISQLNYTGDVNGNLTRHNMFVNTTCPGPYLQSKFPYIVKMVNAKLTGQSTPVPDNTSKTDEALQNQLNEMQKVVADLQQQVTALNTKVTALQHTATSTADYAGIKYNYVDDYMPEFAHETINKIIELGAFKGDLQLSYDDLRILTLIDRLNIIDNSVLYNTIEEIPEYGKAVVQRLINAEVIKGDGNGLAITESVVRMLCYLDRMNLLTV